MILNWISKSKRRFIIFTLISLIIIYLLFVNNYLKKVEIPGSFEHSERSYKDLSTNYNRPESQNSLINDEPPIGSNTNNDLKLIQNVDSSLDKTIILNAQLNSTQTDLPSNKSSQLIINITDSSLIKDSKTDITKVDISTTTATKVNLNFSKELCPMIPPNLGKTL